MGFNQLVEFYADGRSATVHTTPDLDFFGARAILRLVAFFPTRLSADLFWPTEGADSASA
jgi:hypothetical protein